MVLTEGALPDPLLLPAIEGELARRNPHLRFNHAGLEARYEAERQARARMHNRIAISIYIVIFDLFVVTQIRGVPEIVVLSIILRFVFLTPAVLLFVVFDWLGQLGRWIGPAVTAIAVAPTLAAVTELAFTTSPAALPNIQAIPLDLLIVFACCFSLPQATIITCCSILPYIVAVLLAPLVPPDFRVSMVLTDLAVGAAALAFAMRIDMRDRQVFLLGLKAQIDGQLLAERNNELVRLSRSDALTGLGNRRCFNETLEEAWEGRAPVALVLFDIDHFKRFNDSFGHRQGDSCLQAVASAVALCVRSPTDTLARYGGEEFALILRGASLDAARRIAERMREAVLTRAIPHPCVGPPGLVTISLGVACMMPSDGSADKLIEAADGYLYAAKRLGRNRVESEDQSEAKSGAYIKLVGTSGA